jgi:hypothetical protein
LNAFKEAEKEALREKKEALIERINAKFGDLKDIDGAKAPKIGVGNIDDAKIIYNSISNTCIFRLETEPLVKLYVINNKLVVNIIVRSLDGKEIAVIEDNTWTIYNNDFEYNNDETAFELVTKGERCVYFQIVFRNGVAHISGCLLDKKGRGAAFFNMDNTSNLFAIKPDSKNVIDMNKILNLNIPRIFKYPREKHIGERFA